ncbi:MAG: GGDEF domain-containing protein [Vicinamibacterales bacterium]
MKGQITKLELRTGATEGRADSWFHDFAARALGVVQALVAVENDPDDAPLVAELERLARTFGLESSLAAPAASADACLYRSRMVAQRGQQRREERKREMTAILALVREAMDAAGAEFESFATTVGASTDSLGAIAQMDDPGEVRRLLAAQVAQLKQSAAERRASWVERQQTLTGRLETLEQQLQETRREAARDPLTGIANRGAFDREIETRIQIPGAKFVLAILDMDNLKVANDTHGHPAGDKMIVAVGRALSTKLRSEDFVARLGGDEFAVLAGNLTLAQAERRFGTVLPGLFSDVEEGELPFLPTLSCGLAEFSSGDTPASLYERADQALYAAKKQGKNRVVGRSRSYLRDLLKR